MADPDFASSRTNLISTDQFVQKRTSIRHVKISVYKKPNSFPFVGHLISSSYILNTFPSSSIKHTVIKASTNPYTFNNE